MKSSSGLTMTSIIIYVIGMIIVVGIIATITSFFYTNVTHLSDNSDDISEITKFHMYFLEETTKSGNSITKLEDNSISFKTGNTFTFQDQSIYFNHVKICKNVFNLQFQSEVMNGKSYIKVLITIGDTNQYTKTTQYVVLNESM